MKNIANLLLRTALLLIVATFFSQCDTDCEECTAEKLEPYIIVKFMNQDSLTTIESLRKLTLNRINDGNDLKNEYSKLILEGNDDYIFKRDSIGTLIDSMQTHNTFLGTIVTKINSFKMKIDSIFGNGINEPIYFKNDKTKDTLTQFKFPLNFNSDSSRFTIYFEDTSYVFQVSYTRREYTVVNKIRIGLFNTELDTSSFKEATIECKFTKPECLSNETELLLTF